MGLTVGELAVELDANDSRFRRGLQEDQKRIDSFARRSVRSLGAISLNFDQLAKRAAIGGAALAGVGLAALVVTLKKGVEAANVQERAINSLDAALAPLGPRAGEVSRNLQSFASQLQRVSTLGDEGTIQAQALIASFVRQEDQIKAVTVAAADFAAATGTDLTNAAALLTRTLASDTNALARYGLQVDGAANSTERLESLTRSVAAVFGGRAQAETRTFGGTVAQLSNDFGDLLEEIGFTVTKNELLTNALREGVIPLILRLQKVVADNRDTIKAFVANTIPALIRSFGTLASAVAGILRALGSLASAFDAVQGTVAQFLESRVRARVEQTQALIETQQKAIERFGEERVFQNRRELGQKTLPELREELVRLQGELREAEQTTTQFVDKFNEGTPLIDQFASAAERLAVEAANAADAIKPPELKPGGPEETGGTRTPPVGIPTPAEITGANKLSEIIEKNRVASLSAAQQEAKALDDQIKTIEALQLVESDRARANAEINRLTKERNDLLAEEQRAISRLPGLTEDVQRGIGQLAIVDPRQAADFGKSFQEAIAGAANDPRAQALIAENQAAAIRRALQDQLAEAGPSISETVSEGLAQTSFDGFFAALSGDSVNFAQSFADILSAAVQPKLTEAFQMSVADLGGQIDKTLGGLFGGGAGGGLFGGKGGIFGEGGFFDSNLFDGAGELFGQGALGILSTGISAALKDDDITSTAGSVQSVVNSAERVRGIVAGPTSIAVAQVDRAISDSFVETNGILRAMLAVLERNGQAATGAAGSIASGGSDPISNILANESPSFV